MTDKELIELAAKAAGVNLQQWQSGFVELRDGIVTNWNPLHDDGDALRLAVDLGLELKLWGTDVFASSGNSAFVQICSHPDRRAAVRLAITRAAAKIGRQL